MLCVDLTTAGTVITGNRTKTTAPVDPAESTEVSAEDASSVEPDDDPDHP